MPEAYITATRQYVAQANSWSLEELCLEVNVTNAQGAVLDACSFGIKGQRTRAYRVLAKSPHSELNPGTNSESIVIMVFSRSHHS